MPEAGPRMPPNQGACGGAKPRGYGQIGSGDEGVGGDFKHRRLQGIEENIGQNSHRTRTQEAVAGKLFARP